MRLIQHSIPTLLMLLHRDRHSSIVNGATLSGLMIIYLTSHSDSHLLAHLSFVRRLLIPTSTPQSGISLQRSILHLLPSLVWRSPAGICTPRSQSGILCLNWHLGMSFCALYFLFIPSLPVWTPSQLNLCSCIHMAAPNSSLALVYVMLCSSITFWVLNYQNVNQSESYTWSSQTLQLTTPVLLNNW